MTTPRRRLVGGVVYVLLLALVLWVVVDVELDRRNNLAPPPEPQGPSITEICEDSIVHWIENYEEDANAVKRELEIWGACQEVLDVLYPRVPG